MHPHVPEVCEVTREQPAKGWDGQQPRGEAVMVHLSKEETKGDLTADHRKGTAKMMKTSSFH